MMINYELEKEIIGSLLRDPSLIKNVYLEAEWFNHAGYQEIFRVLSILDGQTSNLFDIYAYVKNAKQDTQVTFKEFNEIEQSIVTTAHILNNATLLRKQYLDLKLLRTAQQATEFLDDEIKFELKNVLTQLERLDTETDEGNLTATYDLIEAKLEAEGDYGIKTFGNLDFSLGGGLYGGMLLTIGARPGVGKTAFGAVNLVDNAIRRNENLAVDIFTLEMSKQELVNRYVSLHTGISTFKLRNPNKVLTPKEKQQVREALAKLRTYNLHIHDKSSYLEDITNHIKKRVFEHGNRPYLCVIDYLGLVKIRGKQRDRRLEIEIITRELKVLANELNIVIILLSQLSRGIEHRQNKIPVLSDLRESGSIEQDSNMVGFLYQPEEKYPKEIELVIRKNREGTLSTLKYEFDGHKMEFEERYQ